MQISNHPLLLKGEGRVMQHHGVNEQHLLHVVGVEGGAGGGGRGSIMWVSLGQYLIEESGTGMVPGREQGDVHYEVATRPLLQQVREALDFLRAIGLMLGVPEVVEVPLTEILDHRANKPQFHGQTHVEEATEQLKAAMWLTVLKPQTHLVLLLHHYGTDRTLPGL